MLGSLSILPEPDANTAVVIRVNPSDETSDLITAGHAELVNIDF